MRQAAMAIGAAALLVAAPAPAQTGARAGTPMQPGAWGPQGWQAGGAMPAYPAPAGATPYATPVAATTFPPGATPGHAVPPSASATRMLARPSGYGSTSPHATSADAYRRRPLERGQKLRGAWKSPIYTVHDWRRYGLPAPGPGMRWSRYHDDAVLVDSRDRVVDARGNLDWNGPTRGPLATLPLRPVDPAPTVRRSVERVGDEIVTTETWTEAVPPAVDLAAYGPGARFTPGTRTTVTTTTETVSPRGRSARRGAWSLRR